MRRIFRHAFAWFAASLGGIAAAHAQTSTDINVVEGGTTAIRITQLAPSGDQVGFTPVQIRLDNRASAERVWAVEFTTGNMFIPQSSTLRSHHRFTVPARTVIEPVVFITGAGEGTTRGVSPLHVEIFGPDVRPGRVMLRTVSGTGSVQPAPWAVAPALLRDVETLLPIPVPGARRPPAPSTVAVDPAQWPADWRLWSPFGAVILDEATHRALDAARRAALHDWVSLGGVLLIEPTLPRDDLEKESVGLGQIITVARPVRTMDYQRLLSLGLSDPARRSTPWATQAALLTATDTERWALKNDPRWLMVGLAVFGILVGPVNLFVFAPSGKRHRLFFTVPALALGASILLAVAIVVRDGLGGAGTRRALVILRPEENKAVVQQQQVSRTGLLVRRTFNLPGDVFLSDESAQAVTPGSRPARGKQLVRDGGQVSGDWFSSHSRQQHQLRRIVPTRARVEIVNPVQGGEAPVVQSTVPATLREFYYLDENGVAWGSAEVPPGRRVPLQKVESFGPAAFAGIELATTRRERGRFYALGGAGELAPIATLTKIDWEDETIVYTGRLEAVTPRP